MDTNKKDKEKICQPQPCRGKSLAMLWLAVVLTMAAGGCDDGAEVVVSNAIIRAPLPGSDTAAGYFQLHNNRAAPLTLVGASSAASRLIEIHQTSAVDGMMRMRRLSQVVIPAGETLAFVRGGHHLMLFGLTALSGTVAVSLHDRDGHHYPVKFQVIDVTQNP